MNLHAYLPGLIDFLAKGVLISVAALPAAWLLRRASAAQRHLVWLCVTGILLALPMVVGWRGSVATSGTSPGSEATVLVVRIPAPAAAEPPLLLAAPSVVTSPANRVHRWFLGQGWRGAVVGLWAGGVLLLLAGRSAAAVRLRGLRGSARTLEDKTLLTLAGALAREAEIRRPIDWRVGEEAPVAMTWGCWRPVILLPHAALTWSRDRLELVLRHELAHVSRSDSLVRELAGFACALHWPNPLVWLVARRLRLAQEQACDDAVLRTGASASAYAEELLAAARAWADQPVGRSALAMAEPSTLERRILGVLGGGKRNGVRRRRVVGAWLVVAAVLASGSMVRVGQGEVAAAGAALKAPAPKPGQPASVSVPDSDPPAADKRQVEVEVRFVELKGSDAAGFAAETFFGAALTRDASNGGPLLGRLPAEEASRRIKELERRPGAEVLSTPRVTVLNGNRATIVVAQELRYPETFDTVPDETTRFETRNIGVEASVLSNIQANGTIALGIETMVREFEGFIGGPPSEGAKKGGAASEEAVVEDPIHVPLFVERADEATVVLRAGEVAVLRAKEKKRVLPAKAPEWARKTLPTEAGQEGRAASPVLIFIGAKVINPPGGGSAAAEPVR
jgi:beta-lactamase regulating signal transducer with metallopeptidase domain